MSENSLSQGYYFPPTCLPSPYSVLLANLGYHKKQYEVIRINRKLHEFHWIKKGKGVYYLDGEKVILSEGDCIFFRAQFNCSYKQIDEPYTTSWIGFYGGDELLNHYNIGNYKIFKAPAFLNNTFGQLMLSCDNGNTEAQRSAACYVFLLDMLEAMSQEQVSTSDLIRKYLEENYNKNISLDDVAENIGMTKFSICRCLRRENKESVMTQLKNIRIANAKTTLKLTDYPITKIATLCGFEDASYFGKVFKEETGLTPLEYRKKFIKQ